MVTEVDVEQLSPASRLAEASEGITLQELALAARNHAMPLEAMRYELTPPGLHYVLVHYDIPMLDADAWRLDIGGQVTNPMSLDLPTVRSLPAHTVRVTLECAGNGRAHLLPRPLSQPWLTGAVGTAEWTGARLVDLLDEAGVHPEASHVVFTGADHGIERGIEDDYRRALPLSDSRAPDVLVAYEMNGQPLPPQHGYPVRLVVPGWYGMAHVKWLSEVSLIDHEFDGYQNAVAYRSKQRADDVGTPVTRIEPRALLVPPGFPDFMSRTRVVRPGACRLEGRAWSGWGPVAGVEFSADDGKTWAETVLDPAVARWAWRRFATTWEASEGVHHLRVRARDESGRVQPVEPGWTRGGFANNSDEPLAVVVADRLPAPGTKQATPV